MMPRRWPTRCAPPPANATAGRPRSDLTRAFLDYARDVQSGALVPAKVDPGIVRDVPLPRPARDSSTASLRAILWRSCARCRRSRPNTRCCWREKTALEAVIAAGRLGARGFRRGSLEPGQSGPAVVALRDRLVAMGLLRPTASAEYDAALGARRRRVPVPARPYGRRRRGHRARSRRSMSRPKRACNPSSSRWSASAG